MIQQTSRQGALPSLHEGGRVYELKSSPARWSPRSALFVAEAWPLMISLIPPCAIALFFGVISRRLSINPEHPPLVE